MPMSGQECDRPPNSDTSSHALQHGVARRLRELCREGYQAYDADDHERALRQFYTAWTLLPKPQSDHPEAGWVLTAIGDCYWAKGDWQPGIEALRSALHCAKAATNPFIHLRLAQCLDGAGEQKAARHHFREALTHGGREWFLARAPLELAQLERDD